MAAHQSAGRTTINATPRLPARGFKKDGVVRGVSYHSHASLVFHEKRRVRNCRRLLDNLLPFLAFLVRGTIIFVEPVLLYIMNDRRRDKVADTHLTA